jgi:hypothetical protein
VKEIGQRPEQVGNIRFEARVHERLGESLEQRGNRGLKRGSFGQRARIGLVVVQVMAMELQLLEHLGGRASLSKLGVGSGGSVSVACHGKVSGKG